MLHQKSKADWQYGRCAWYNLKLMRSLCGYVFFFSFLFHGLNRLGTQSKHKPRSLSRGNGSSLFCTRKKKSRVTGFFFLIIETRLYVPPNPLLAFRDSNGVIKSGYHLAKHCSGYPQLSRRPLLTHPPPPLGPCLCHLGINTQTPPGHKPLGEEGLACVTAPSSSLLLYVHRDHED